MSEPESRIEPVRELSRVSLGVLLRESEEEGFRFIVRLVEEWDSGTDRFDKPGEALFLVAGSESPEAIGGLNIDPYQADSTVARIRHLYVRPAARRRRLGTRLARRLLAHARSRSFVAVRLLTDTDGAAAFYESLGFHRSGMSTDATHELTLTVYE